MLKDFLKGFSSVVRYGSQKGKDRERMGKVGTPKKGKDGEGYGRIGKGSIPKNLIWNPYSDFIRNPKDSTGNPESLGFLCARQGFQQKGKIRKKPMRRRHIL